MTLFRPLVCAALLAFLPMAAHAGERGIVANSGGQLKAEPKPKGKKLEKLKQGSIVDVTDHSGDGKWVKLTYQGPDGRIEGWVEKEFIRSMSRYGFSWERKQKAGAPTKAATVPAAASATPASTSSTNPVELGADAVPMDDGDWSNASSSSDEAADAGASDWGDGAAADDATSSSDSDWGGADDSVAAPTAEPAATPIQTDGETEIDLTQ